MRRVLVVAVLVAPAACWSALTSTPDVFGPGASGDAGASADRIGEGAAPNEGGSGSAFCASLNRVPTLCADFEQGPPDASFENTEIYGGGAFTIEPRDDGGLALLVRSPDAGPLAGAILSRSFPGLPRSVHLAFDLRADAFSPGSAITIASIRMDRPDGGFEKIDLWARRQFSVVQDLSGDMHGADSTKVFPTGEWKHVELAIDFAGAAPHATVLVDGETHADYPLAAAPGTFNEETSFELGMRIGPPDPMQGPTVLHFDNVVLDLTPL